MESYQDIRILVRKTATEMFAEGGTPTVELIHQRLGRGDTKVIADELDKWWRDLRARVNVVISAPGVPDSLLALFSESAAYAWALATSETDKTLHLARAQTDRKLNEAQTRAVAVEEQYQACNALLIDAKRESKQLTQEIDSLKHTLFTEQTNNSALVHRADKLNLELERMRLDADKLRIEMMQKLKLAEERYQALEQKALLEINQAWTKVAEVKQSFETERASRDKLIETLNQQLQELREYINSLPVAPAQ